MTKAAKFHAAALAAIVCASAVAQTSPKQFGIPGAGNLVLDVPATWRVLDRQIPDPAGVVIAMRPSTGDAWNLQMTSVRADPKRPQPTPEALKERLQGIADKMLDNAVEKKAILAELHGKQAAGYYFSLTDKTSKNGANDYKYITQGTLVTGEVTTVFTFLHRDAVPPEKEQALRMLADARFAKGTPAAAAPRPDALQITEKGDAYVLAVPVSQLIMTVPKAGLQRASSPASNHPRYFYFTGGGLNVSGWFEPASGYSGIEEFWKKESASWNKALPAPSDVAFSKVGNWDVVSYDLKMQMPGGGQAINQSNIRAHWVQSGTWIDVHASVTSSAPAAESRTKLIAFLQTLDVKEKEK